jgi:hypothetical protein
MGQIISTIFILMAGQSAPGTPDPRQEFDYHRCMSSTIAEHGYLSPEWARMDGFCAAVAALDTSIPV